MAESSLERILGTMSPDFGFVSRENSLDRFMRAPSRQVCVDWECVLSIALALILFGFAEL